MQQIPYIAHESSLARMERTNRRLWIISLVLIIALLGTNAGWLWYESQYQYIETSTEITQENESGYNNYIGNDGDIYNGEANDQNNN